MCFRFERLKCLGRITSSITIARFRVFTRPRTRADVRARRRSRQRAALYNYQSKQGCPVPGGRIYDEVTLAREEIQAAAELVLALRLRACTPTAFRACRSRERRHE